MRAAQKVPGSRVRHSESGLRTTGIHELDRQSQRSRWGCHSRELQDKPFTFCRRFGTSIFFSTVFSMHSIGFLPRATDPEWKSSLNIEVLCLSPNPRQCIRQVNGNTLRQVYKFKYLGVVFTSDERRSAMRLIHGLVKLTLFCVCFICWPIQTSGDFIGYWALRWQRHSETTAISILCSKKAASLFSPLFKCS